MQLKGFFAYPSIPSIMEVVKESITHINTRGSVHITPWEDLRISGKTVINSICDEIDNVNIFCADLTYLNSNVLFELGYAIAKNKRIIVFLDPSIEKSKNDFERFNLSTLGYLPYSNSREMVDGFFKENPCNSLERTVLQENKNNYALTSSGILYLKSLIDTQASVKLSQILRRTKVKPLVIDDPQETRMQIHSWYVEQAINAYAIVGHLVSDEHAGKELHNTKISFVIGLGLGFKKDVLMLAHEPFRSPFDYRHILKTHSTATECEKHIQVWHTDVQRRFIDDQKKAILDRSVQKAEEGIKSIDVGEYIAEQESERIKDYFIETAAYREAIRSKYTIFIGRKGTGKSAILYQLEYDLSQDTRNFICVIKPISYELNGLVEILKAIEGNAEKGFLIESLWKYLIYSEMAKSIYETISDRPSYYELKDYEDEIIKLINNYSEIIMHDFSIRLENILTNIAKIDMQEKGSSQRIKISEILHDSLISKLRDVLHSYFQNKQRIVILIDNLDKTWKHSDDITYLSQFFLGLLSVSTRITDDFKIIGKHRLESHFSMVIFLRSDIFTFIYKEARERDKIKYYTVSWEDPELLLRVVEKRIQFSLFDESVSDIWAKYFCQNVDNLPIKDFIIQNIVARPRDILFLIKFAHANAINRKHSMISSADIKDAVIRYSQHAIDSLIVENGISIDQFENLLYEFVGLNSILSESKINSIVEKSGIDNMSVENIIDLLCDRCFLGRMIGENIFRYQYNYLDRDKIIALSRKYYESCSDKKIYYEINVPYRAYLEIK